MKSRGIAAACILCFVALTTSGCGFRLVRRTDITARKFAADSAMMVSLQRQIVSIQAQCRADSLRAAAQRATVPTRVSTAPVASDSIVRARDTEIAALRDQLTRANAELDRIKRRLANPRS